MVKRPTSAKFDPVYLLALLLLAILVYFPLVGTGFTTADDLQFATNGITGFEAAAVQGRIGFFIGMPLIKLPYLFDNQLYFNFVRLGSPALLLGILYVLLRHVCKNSALAALAIGYFLAFIQNGWEHNPLTSYPGAFNIQFAAFLAAVLAFCFAVERKSKLWALVAAGLYGFTLANESFLLYGVVFFGIALFDSTLRLENVRIADIAKQTFRKLIPIIAVAILYLIAYSLWRNAYPSQYSGNTINLSEPRQIFRVLWVFSTSAFPGYKFFKNEWQYHSLVTSYAPAAYQLRTVAAEMRAEWIVKALLVACLTASMLAQKSIRQLTTRNLLAVLILSFGCIFIPNILVSLTEVYRTWVKAGSTSYHYTYYSFVAIVVLLAVLSVMLVNSLAERTVLRTVAVFLIAVLASTLSITTDFHNYFVAKDQKLSQKKWTVMEQFLKTDAFAKIPSGSVVYAPTLYLHRNILEIPPNYWADYIRVKTGKTIVVIEKAQQITETMGESIFYLKYLQDSQGINQILIFSPLTDLKRLFELGRIASKSAVIFSYSPARNLVLMGHNTKGKLTSVVEVNGIAAKESDGLSFSHAIGLDSSSSFPAINVRSNDYLDIDNLSFSFFPDDLLLSPARIALGESFYGWELPNTPDSRSWSKGSATLIATNFSQIAIKAVVSMRMTSLTPRSVSIGVGDRSKVVQVVPNDWVDGVLEVELKPGKTEITLRTETPPIFPTGADRRQLSFAISRLAVTSTTAPQVAEK